MSDLHDSRPAPIRSRPRSGTFFVSATILFLVLFGLFLWVVSPQLKDQLGLNEGVVPFDAPPAPVQVPLTIDGAEVGLARWDAEGVCAQVTDRTGTTFEACAEPDPLKPIWAIEAPDQADPPYLLVATPPQAISLSAATVDGRGLDAMTQARELPAAWAVMALPEGAIVQTIVARNTEGADLGSAECGVEDAPKGGPVHLDGGCLVPRED